MGQPQKAAELLDAGYSPCEIASELGISPSSAKSYLYQAVGHGFIRRSDILFSIDKKTRDITKEYMAKYHIDFWFDICNTAEQNGIKKIEYVDYEYLNVLGFYQQFKVIPHGE